MITLSDPRRGRHCRNCRAGHRAVMRPHSDPSISIPRRWVIAILGFGAAGAGIELLLLEHYEDPWQLVPLCLIALALVVLCWHAVGGTAASVWALQGTMALFVLAGIVGVLLHYRGAVAFQLEIDASQHGWALWNKVLRAKAPPVLAPGLMMQLGFLGLAYAYRHPAVASPASSQKE